jgi:catechol 2,3-dioxygenase-like lactoylglutathione lyase family enzyme
MHIGVVTLPVADLDRAIEFYTKALGWEKIIDAPMQDEQNNRWVTVAPPGSPSTPQNSHTARQNASRLSTDHRHSAS